MAASRPASSILSSYLRLPSISHQMWLLVAVNIQQAICGYGIGISAPALSQLTEEGLLSAGQLAWFASCLVIGQVPGSILGPLLADRVGRRTTCLLASAASLATWVALSTSQSGWVLLASRLLTGFSDCLAVPTGIMFLSEVSEVRNRGPILNSTALASGLGIALAYLVGGATTWRVATLLPPILTLVAIPVLALMKESPVFLLRGGREAVGALHWYREDTPPQERSVVEKELEEMRSSMEGESMTLIQTATKIFEKQNRKPFLILLVLFTLYPLTGMYSIAFFAIDLFQKLELGSVQVVAVSSALVRVLGTMLSSGLMSRYGRRALYIPASALCCLSIGMVGALVKIRDAGVGLDDRLAAWTMVILIFLFMFSVGIAIANFPWVLMAEWFPPDLKSLVTSTLITCQFGFIFLAVQLTSSLLSLLGPGGLFLYFSTICSINTLFVALMVPETHGHMFSSLNLSAPLK